MPHHWRPIGGHPALDLCNTRSWRLDPARSHDRIATGADFLDWYGAVIEPGHPGEPPPEEPELVRIRALRDAAIGVLDAHLEQVPGPPADVETLHAAWPEALTVATPSSRLPLTWAASAPGPALTLAVLDLLRRDDLDRLRRCDGPGCGWLFLDHTRNRSRRWCDPADCGNRARVRAYAERWRQSGPVG